MVILHHFFTKDTYMYDTDFTSDQKTSFHRSFINPCVCLQNRNTAFSYSDPIGITTQYLNLQYSATIQQLVIITNFIKILLLYKTK